MLPPYTLGILKSILLNLNIFEVLYEYMAILLLWLYLLHENSLVKETLLWPFFVMQMITYSICNT